MKYATAFRKKNALRMNLFYQQAVPEADKKKSILGIKSRFFFYKFYIMASLKYCFKIVVNNNVSVYFRKSGKTNQ